MRCVGRAGVRASVLAALVLALCTGTATAHDFSVTDVVATLEADGSYRVEITADLDALALGIAPSADDAELQATLAAMSPAELEATIERLGDTILRRTRVRFEAIDRDMRFELPDEPVQVDGLPSFLGTRAYLVGRIPADATSFGFGASRAFGMVRLTVHDRTSGARVEQLLVPGEDSEPVTLGLPPAPPRRGAIAWRYLTLGFTHILPYGADHVLFVLGLFLLAARWRPLLAQITAFTVAHTVTLALSIHGVVRLPSRPVETLIAVSIAWIAIENLLTSELKPWRPVVVFGFGLLHGLGFAGVLRDLGLPTGEVATALVAFNVGVELGQIAVVLVALGLVGRFRDRTWYRARITVPASAAIGLVGLWWAISRGLGWG